MARFVACFIRFLAFGLLGELSELAKFLAQAQRPDHLARGGRDTGTSDDRSYRGQPP